MKFLLCFVFFLIFTYPQFAQAEEDTSLQKKETSNSELTLEERERQLLLKEFNSKIYTPFQAKMIYRATLQAQQPETKTKMLNELARNADYSEDDLEALSKKMEEEPFYKDPLNEKSESELNKLIQDDTPEALVQIFSSGKLNEAFLPSDESDEAKKILTESFASASMPRITISDNEDEGKTSSFPSEEEILSLQKFYINPINQTPGQQKRLGYKSYFINPDNFTYEEDN